MQRILNDPDNIVDEMLQGFFKAHCDLVERTSNPRVVKAKNIPRDKVGVVTGGGSGHKPAFVGYVGKNLCDAAAVGEIFSSPTPGAFLDAMTCAGAKAAQGADLDQVAATAQKAIDNTRSVGVGLKPCVLPAIGHPGFEIEEGTMELGIGHHGEPGVAVVPMETADKLAERMLDMILADHPYKAGDEAAVLLSGLGATPVMELYVLYNEVEKQLTEKGIGVYRAYVGNYFTSLDMAGATLSLMKTDDELKELLAMPAYSMGWK